jgi:Zn-finger nucleic acid-binding protein
MDITSASCPRCKKPLAPVDLSGVEIRSCAECDGTLLARAALSRVLEALSVEMLKTFDPDMKLEPLKERDGGLVCPGCGQKMDHDDYCGASLVFFDRCEACELLWLDADKLGTMTLMWARMESRHARDRAESEKVLEEVGTFVRRVLTARALSNLMR